MGVKSRIVGVTSESDQQLHSKAAESYRDHYCPPRSQTSKEGSIHHHELESFWVLLVCANLFPWSFDVEMNSMNRVFELLVMLRR